MATATTYSVRMLQAPHVQPLDANDVAEKLLDTLSPADHARFVELLQPEVTRTKRIITGKNVTAVSNLK